MDNESFLSPSIPSIPSNPSFATPSIPSAPTTIPTLKATAVPQDDTVNECVIYKFIGNIFKIEESEHVNAQMKQDTVAMIFNGYEQDQFKPHILNLVKYINGQSTLSDKAKLTIIQLDLNELLNKE